MKKLTILLAAVVALGTAGAISAAGAQAAPQFHCSVEPCKITFRNDGTAKTGHLVFDAAGTSLTCKTLQADATSSTKTFTTTTITGIVLNECPFLGQETGVFVKFNSCGLTLHTEPTGDDGRFTIVDCGGQEIEFGISGVCTIKIPEQQIEFKPITYHTITPAGQAERELTIEVPTVGKELPAFLYTATGPSCLETGQHNNGKVTTGNLIATSEQDPAQGAAVMGELWFE
jgi:hypothetical protein